MSIERVGEAEKVRPIDVEVVKVKKEK